MIELMTEAEQTGLVIVQAAIADCLEKLEQLRSSEANLQRRTKVTCWACGADWPIGELDYIQTHWWSNGHQDGGYWTLGEGHWKCPTCGHENRLFDKPEIEKLNNLFSMVINCYCEKGLFLSPNRICKECRLRGQ